MSQLKFNLVFLMLCCGVFTCFSQISDTTIARVKLDSVGLLIDSLKYGEAIVKADEALSLCLKGLGENHLLTAKAFYDKGKATSLAGKRKEALGYHQAALKIREKLLENNHPDISESLAKIGTTFYLLEKFDSAIFYQEKSLKFRLEVYGEAHSSIAENYYGLGITYVTIGNLDTAMEMLNKALYIQNYLYGGENQKFLTAEIYNVIGGVHDRKSEYKEANEYIKKAAKISEKLLPKNHPNISSKYMNIGLGNFKLGEYDSALYYLRSALTSKIAVSGNCHVDVSHAHCLIGNVYYYQDEFKKAIDEFKAAEDIALRSMGESNLYLAQAYNGSSVTYQRLADYKKASYYTEKALNIYDKILPVNHPDRVNVVVNIGILYFHLSKYELSLKYLYEAEYLLSQIGYEESYHASSVLMNIGLNYFGMGNFEKALSYLDRSLFLKSKLIGETHPETIEVLINIGNIYVAIGDTKKAIEVFRKALKITKENQRESYSFCLQNIGNAFYNNNELDSALYYSDIALNNALVVYGENHPSIALIISNTGKIYADKGEYSAALDLLLKALEIYKQTYGEIHRELARTNYFIGSCYKNIGRGDLAIQFFENAIRVEEIVFGVHHPESAETYFDIGQVYFSDKKYDLAKKYFDASLLCFDNNRKLFNNSISKEVYDIRNSRIPEKMIGYSFEDSPLRANFLQESFVVSEKVKGNMLIDAIRNTYATHFSDIPDSLLEKERNLQEDILYQEKVKNELFSKEVHNTDSSVYTINKKLNRLNSDLEALVEKLETEYPKYYRAKYDFSAVDVIYVQKYLLAENQSLLEYLVGDSSIFAFLVRQDTFIVREIGHDFPLEQWVTDMVKGGINGYHALPDTDTLKRDTAWIGACDRKYTRSAYQLYEKLVAPVAAWMTDTVIIVPDGVLGYVPFEALLTAMPPTKAIGKFSFYDFMLEKHQISYCYSATLLREMREKQHLRADSKGLLAMAPFFQGDVKKMVEQVETTNQIIAGAKREALTPLNASGEEVATIARLMGGDAVYGSAASVEAFRERAEGYRILHLSTHGKANDQPGDYAYLAFGVPGDTTFGKLYARDLYNYSLNADMVVLSACETGLGKLRRGEGIVSLARAFAYAGAKSIFPTLWQVSDTRTAELMKLFYENLKGGMAKDAALRQAKLDYLNNNKGPSAHPYYWAAMIGIGDMRAVQR